MPCGRQSFKALSRSLTNVSSSKGGCLPADHLLVANLEDKHELSNLDLLDLSYLKLAGLGLPSPAVRSRYVFRFSWSITIYLYIYVSSIVLNFSNLSLNHTFSEKIVARS